MPNHYTNAVLFQNGSIGDFLMALFLAECLVRGGVAEKILIVVPRGGAFYRGFLGAYPYITLLELSRTKFWNLVPLVPYAFTRTLALLPPTPGALPRRTKIVARLITRMPASQLVGFADTDSWTNRLYDQVLPYDVTLPILDTFRQELQALGLSETGGVPAIRLPEDVRVLKRFELVGKRYVVFHPHGSSSARSFTSGEAMRLIQTIASADPDCRVVITGSAAERSWLMELVRLSGQAERCRVLCGAPPARLATLIRHSTLYIGVDTGITHLACFLGARALVVAHNATANWLPFYQPSARILYQLEGDTEVHEDYAYLHAHQAGRLKPFGRVPEEVVARVVQDMLQFPQ